jgi:hypothetical protein
VWWDAQVSPKVSDVSGRNAEGGAEVGCGHGDGDEGGGLQDNDDTKTDKDDSDSIA